MTIFKMVFEKYFLILIIWILEFGYLDDYDINTFLTIFKMVFENYFLILIIWILEFGYLDIWMIIYM